jgi:glutaredoxin-related protein
MKKTEKTIIEYSETCPKCKKVIKSVDKKQLNWNFKVHKKACKKK